MNWELFRKTDECRAVMKLVSNKKPVTRSPIRVDYLTFMTPKFSATDLPNTDEMFENIVLAIVKFLITRVELYALNMLPYPNLMSMIDEFLISATEFWMLKIAPL
jgi:hypothetical protein